MLLSNTNVVCLGEPTAVLELHFSSIKDEDLSIGQIVVLWDEIVCRKIGDALYEVYDLKEYQVHVPDFDGDLLHKIATDRPTFRLIDSLPEKPWYSQPKYVRTSKGTKKVKPWEGPMYF